MQVLIYENFLSKMTKKSGVGKAITHQKKALDLMAVTYTDSVKDSFDVAHFNFYDPFAYFTMKRLKKKNIPIVVHAHSTEEDFRNSFVFSNQIAPFFKKWLIKFYSVGDVIITPTPYSKKLIKNYGITVPIFDLSNGIDLNEWQLDSGLKKYFNQLHNITPQTKVIMNIGFPIERKGVFDFIEISKQLPNYEFYWLGETPKALQKRKITKAISNAPKNCHFLGYTSGVNKMAAFNRADCFFFPSYEETEGIVVLEALAMHLPIIIRNIPVYDDWIIDKKHAYKGNNNNEFIDLITNITNQKLPDLTKAGYKIAANKDIKIIGEKLVNIYQSIIK